MNILRKNLIDIVEGKHCKPSLKKLILDNIKNVHFNKPIDAAKSKEVISTIARRHSEVAKGRSLENGDLQVSLDAAKVLRREIEDLPLWKFEGNFDDYEDHTLLL